jgi:iron transport multicopper oxidase
VDGCSFIFGISHIDWHLDAGLAIVFAEDTADVATHNPVSG